MFFCLTALLLVSANCFALDKRASLALSHYIMAGVYDQSGQLQESIREYREALKADYKNAAIHTKLASSYIRNKEFDKAAAQLNLAISLDPETVEAHALLALLYSFQNRPEEASREYEVALSNASKLEPRNSDIYRSLAAFYLQQKRFQDAQKYYRLILEISPGDPQAHFYLGSIYDELKDRQQAEIELKAALEAKPDYPQALNYLGYLYVEENKNLDAAEAMIRKALEIEPDNGAYVDSLGWLYFKQGKLEEAVKELERASLLLEDPVIYDHLGDAYLKMGNTDKAKINWQKFLNLEPGEDKVKAKLESINK